MFRLIERYDMSLKDIVELDAKGFSVMKTPHVGNVYMNNLAIASLGIRMLFYDRNYGRMDKLFYPHRIIQKGKSEEVSSPDKLMTHARVERKVSNPDLRRYFRSGCYVGRAHMRALKEKIPDIRAEVYTDYLERQKETAIKFLEIWTSINPSEWNRSVSIDGEIHEVKISDWKDVLKSGIYGLTSRKSGLLIPNIFNVALSTLLEYSTYGHNRVYHLSGPAMIKYAGQMVEPINRLFQSSVKELRTGRAIEMHLIPAASMVFASPASVSEEMDQCSKLIIENSGRINADKSCGAFSEASKKVSRLGYVLKSPDKGKAFTHYDISENDPIIVSDFARNQPMSYFTETAGIMSSLRKFT